MDKETPFRQILSVGIWNILLKYSLNVEKMYLKIVFTNSMWWILLLENCFFPTHHSIILTQFFLKKNVLFEKIKNDNPSAISKMADPP